MLTKAQIRQANAARSLLDENPAAYIQRHTIAGHSTSAHVTVAPETALDNVLSGAKRGDTIFNDAKTQEFCITEILYAKMMDIQNFAATAKPGENKLLSASFTDIEDDPKTGEEIKKPIYIGEGFISNRRKGHVADTGCQIDAIKTNAAAVAIKANPMAPDGWEIISAFPLSHNEKYMHPEDQENMSIQPDYQGFSDILHKTRTYAAASPLLRVYMDNTCSGKPMPDGMSMQYQKPRTYNQDPRIVVSDNKTKPMALYGGETAPPRTAVVVSPRTNDLPPSSQSVKRAANALKDQLAQTANDMSKSRQNRRDRAERLASRVAAHETQSDYGVSR